jgi:hypothetical protein
LGRIEGQGKGVKGMGNWKKREEWYGKEGNREMSRCLVERGR